MPWYKLPRSGVAYWARRLPAGAQEVPPPGGAGPEPSDAEPDPAAILDANVATVVRRASDADLDTIEALLEAEHAGAARKGLIDQLARMRDRLTDEEG